MPNRHKANVIKIKIKKQTKKRFKYVLNGQKLVAKEKVLEPNPHAEYSLIHKKIFYILATL